MAADPQKNTTKEEEEDAAAAAKKKHLTWGYGKENGPQCWADLNPNCTLCQQGTHQSPIDISTKDITQDNKMELHLNYPDMYNGFIMHNGHTVQIACNKLHEKKESAKDDNKKDDGNGNDEALINSYINEYQGYFELFKEKYYLKQFHFHSPSEHQIDSQSFDLCCHFVHQSDDGAIGVIGMLFNVDKNGKDENSNENEFLAQFFNNLPQMKDANKQFRFKDLNVKDGKFESKYLLDTFKYDKNFYYYQGSLTTPPCTEGVRWIVMSKVRNISMKQLKSFTDAMNNEKNARPIQNAKHQRRDTKMSNNIIFD